MIGNKFQKLKIISVMEKAIEWAITILLSLMVVNIAVAVFCRYVLNHSFSWAEELGRYLMIWVGYLGASLAMKTNEHIGLTGIISILPLKFRKLIGLVSRVIVEVFLIIIIVNSFKHLGTLSIQRSSAMEIPMIIPYLSVTVGSFLMAVEEILHIIKILQKGSQLKQE